MIGDENFRPCRAPPSLNPARGPIIQHYSPARFAERCEYLGLRSTLIYTIPCRPDILCGDFQRLFSLRTSPAPADPEFSTTLWKIFSQGERCCRNEPLLNACNSCQLIELYIIKRATPSGLKKTPNRATCFEMLSDWKKRPRRCPHTAKNRDWSAESFN